MLKSIIDIIRMLDGYKYNSNTGIVKGNLCKLTPENIKQLKIIKEYLGELQDTSNNFFTIDDLNNHIDNSIKIEISIANIKGYYDTFSSFLNKNKTTTVAEFYIKNIDYLHHSNSSQCSNQKIDNYFKNIELIKFLERIADYKNRIGTDLELFFYKAEKSLRLSINYNAQDLQSLNISSLNELKDHFFHKSDKEERKQIFINEVVELLKNDNSYSYLLQKWDDIQDNYQKAFRFYLSGFSFEKIKTSSLGYFQELIGSAYNQINKATANIFIVPAAYIFLLKSFSLSSNRLSNILLLVTALIFAFLMDKVIFNNISEGLDAVKADMNRFKEKVDDSVLEGLSENLEELDKTIKKQYNKVKILKWANRVLFSMLIIMFLYAESTSFACYLNSIL